jgi:hypothetical protein
MARVTKVVTSGKIGPVISYEFRGKPCVRAKPEIVRQPKRPTPTFQLDPILLPPLPTSKIQPNPII